MKKILLSGISAILLISFAPLIDWACYRDKKPFISPIGYVDGITIRKDAYGAGYFGAKRRGGRRHKGIDIEAPLGSSVIASKGGRAHLGFQKTGMGKYVMLYHPGGYSTLYGHLDKQLIRDGERVRQGAAIGRVGKTGNAKYKNMKPHLHFEIKSNGEYIAPLSRIE